MLQFGVHIKMYISYCVFAQEGEGTRYTLTQKGREPALLHLRAAMSALYECPSSFLFLLFWSCEIDTNQICNF